MSRDIKKRAALVLLSQGKMTVAEAAHLCGVSRQSVAAWVRDVDVRSARRKLLAKEFAAQMQRLDK